MAIFETLRYSVAVCVWQSVRGRRETKRLAVARHWQGRASLELCQGKGRARAEQASGGLGLGVAKGFTVLEGSGWSRVSGRATRL